MGLIEVKELSKFFMVSEKYKIWDLLSNNVEYVKVLSDINLSIKPGEIYGVLGKNGAGKSTLLRVLGGIYSYEGMILLEGNVTSIFELGSFLNVNQTGEEYCKDFFFFTMKNYDRELVRQLINDIREFTELDDYFRRPIYTYSSGMKAKLLFAVVTALKAEIVLIDEALVVGDAYFQGKAIRRLKKMIQKGTVGIMVSHDWTALLRFCSRGCILDKGRINFEGEIRSTISEYVQFEKLHSDIIKIFNKEILAKKTVEWEEEGRLDFTIEVMQVPPTEEVEANIFIEKFSQGLGWNLVYTNGAYFKIKKKGIYKVSVWFPDLGLEEGIYNVGIHLLEVHMYKKEGVAKAYDRMTWLEKNGIELKIGQGQKKQAIMRRKLEWKVM